MSDEIKRLNQLVVEQAKEIEQLKEQLQKQSASTSQMMIDNQKASIANLVNERNLLQDKLNKIGQIVGSEEADGIRGFSATLGIIFSVREVL